ncbi:MAG: hypothetical protein ACREN4_06685 [Candidatus Dormibacteria bacterium]
MAARAAAEPTRLDWMETWRITALAVICGLAITVGGSYGLGWRWTGFAANGNLWDWLHLLLLPIVLGALPIWVKTQGRDRVPWRLALAGSVVALGVLALGGYLWGWAWTGIAGNRLWDWLHLLVLPVVVGLSPLWFTRSQESMATRRRAAISGGLALLAAVALIGGYAWGWAWTGFAGNRLWDWLQLLLVPVLVPIVFAWLAVRLGEARQEQSQSQLVPAAPGLGPPASD